MFGSPNTTVGSLIELMKSNSSASSSICQDSDDNAGRNIRSGAPSLMSNSPTSFTSLKSRSRYQPSSCSTYSASAAPRGGPSPQIFKRQYIRQAVRLVDDAVKEQDKGSCCDEAYALDCYFASLEYLLSAISAEAALQHQIGSVDRQAIVHTKLAHLLRRAEEISFPVEDQEAASIPEQLNNSWWQGVWGKRDLVKNDPANPSTFSLLPSDLAAQCTCGRKVLVQIPECFFPSNNQPYQPENELIDNRSTSGSGWYEWIVAPLLWAFGIINGTVIPYIVVYTITTLFSWALYIERRLNITNLIMNIVISIVQIFLQICRDFQLNQQIRDLFSWAVLRMVKFALAFVRRDDMRNLDELFDLRNGSRKEDSAMGGTKVPVDRRMNELMNTEVPVGRLPHQRFNLSSSGTSRISSKSSSTYQVNRTNSNYLNSLKESNLSPSSFRTRSYGL